MEQEKGGRQEAGKGMVNAVGGLQSRVALTKSRQEVPEMRGV